MAEFRGRGILRFKIGWFGQYKQFENESNPSMCVYSILWLLKCGRLCLEGVGVNNRVSCIHNFKVYQATETNPRPCLPLYDIALVILPSSLIETFSFAL